LRLRANILYRHVALVFGGRTRRLRLRNARDGEPDDTDESRNFRDHNASVGKARSYSQSNSEGMPGAAGIPAAQRSLHHRSAPAIETRDLMEPSLGRYSMPWKTTVYSQNR
jgi:hypothetical protein